LEEIVAAPVNKTENTTGGIRCADHATPSTRKSWYYFAKKRRSLGRRGFLNLSRRSGSTYSHFLNTLINVLLLLAHYLTAYISYKCFIMVKLTRYLIISKISGLLGNSVQRHIYDIFSLFIKIN
jgi:hypothetical protein